MSDDQIPPQIDPSGNRDEPISVGAAEEAVSVSALKHKREAVSTLLVCISWLVIFGATAMVAGLVAFTTFGPQDGEFSKAELIQSLVVGKYLLGAAEVAGVQATTFDLNQLDDGPLEQRFCYTILVNEFRGPKEAREALQSVHQRAEKHGVKLDARQDRLHRSLLALFDDYQSKAWQGPTVDVGDQEYLQEELGWFGDLALNPKEKSPAGDRHELVRKAGFTFVAALMFVLMMVAGLIAGVIGIVVFLVMSLKSVLRSWMDDYSGHGGVYAETFAIWVVLFFGGGILVELAHVGSPGISMLFSLTALIWPRLRGISGRQLREDIGWRVRNPVADVAGGLAAYVSMLPFLAIGLLTSQFLMVLVNTQLNRDEYAPGGGVGHPIVDELLGTEPWQAVLHVFFLTVVVAPLVEETMFRGVLYRHLRDATSRWRRFTSVAFAAAVNSFIFAAIHPQGVFGVPMLFPLAFGFSLVRQWRGSLIGPMVMHAVHNFLVTTALVLMLL